MSSKKILLIDRNKCIRCFGCISVCPVQALEYSKEGPKWIDKRCTNCKICSNFCPVRAIRWA